MLIWVAIQAIASAILVLVGAWQILAIRRQNKHLRTLEAVEVYDRDPIIDMCARNLFAARRNGEWEKDPSQFRIEVTTILNYLDGIATGIEQNLYVESIVRDHLGPVIVQYVTEAYLESRIAQRIGIEPMKDYPRLLALVASWKPGEEGTKFFDGWFKKRRS